MGTIPSQGRVLEPPPDGDMFFICHHVPDGIAHVRLNINVEPFHLVRAAGPSTTGYACLRLEPPGE